MDLISELSLESIVTFVGEVLGERKRVLLGGADVFALTSRQEGDSIAIKEAMASALPLIISRQCHYPEFESMKIAKVVQMDSKDIADAIAQLSDNVELQKEMSKNALTYARDNLDQPMSTEKLIGAYKDLLDGGKDWDAWVNNHGR